MKSIRDELESLVAKWRERQDQQSKMAFDIWHKKKSGYPVDYHPDPEGVESRKQESIDIMELKKEVPHNISLRELGNKTDNCHAYTLSKTPLLSEMCEFIKKAELNAGQFLSRLERDGLLKESDDGQIALYFQGYALKHSGLMEESQVISKWGGGNVYSHGIFEVPTMYGDGGRYKLTDNLVLLEQCKAKFRSEHPISNP